MTSFNWAQYEDEGQSEKPVATQLQDGFDWDKYEDKESQPIQEQTTSQQQEESGLRKAARYALQVPSGIAQAFTWPLGLVKSVGSAQALEDLRRMQIEEPENVNPQAFMQAVENVSSYFPDQENAEKFLESQGIPIEAKTTGQKLLKLGATAATFQPGGLLQRGAAAGTAASTSGTLRAAGAPEPIADLAGLLSYPIGKAASTLLKPTGNRAQELAKSLYGGGPPGGGGPGLPPSSYEVAERHLKELGSLEAQEIASKPAKKPPLGGGPPPPPSPSAPLLSERVKAIGKDVGLRPPSASQTNTLANDIGKVVSPQQFYNTTEGGKGIMREVREIDQKAYRKVNELYNISKEANKGVEDIHPNLVADIDERLSELMKIPEPSTPQAKMISALRKIKGRLVEVDSDGNISGYKPISNQALIDQNQSLNQIIDFDFAHGDANNIFKPLIKDIENSITSAAEQSGQTAAVKSWENAKQGYKVWSDTFNNDYIRPLRNTTNKDYSTQFKKLLDVDEINVLSNVLNQTEKGKMLVGGIKRDLLEKHLGKYFENPQKVNLNEFNKSLRELEAVLNENEVQAIRDAFNKHRKSPPLMKAKVISNEPEKILDKYLGKEPEYIQGKFDTRSGIREMREASKNPKAKETFDILAKQKMRSILQEGNIEKNFTGNDLYNVLNKEKNAEIFREIIGEEATETARLAAKEIGKKQMRAEAIKDVSKKAGTLKFLHWILPLI